MSSHVPEADSTWAPFTFRGVRTTRGSITAVFFFCLLACISKRNRQIAGVTHRARTVVPLAQVSTHCLVNENSCSTSSRPTGALTKETEPGQKNSAVIIPMCRQGTCPR